jgi:hypothetical protein
VGDTRESRALLVQSQDFVIPRLASVVQRRGETGIGDQRGRRPVHRLAHDHGNWGTDCLNRLLLLKYRLGGGVQSALLSTDNSFDNIRQVLEYVKAISHLHGRGSTTSDSFGIGPSPVAGDEFDRRLALLISILWNGPD